MLVGPVPQLPVDHVEDVGGRDPERLPPRGLGRPLQCPLRPLVHRVHHQLPREADGLPAQLLVGVAPVYGYLLPLDDSPRVDVRVNEVDRAPDGDVEVDAPRHARGAPHLGEEAGVAVEHPVPRDDYQGRFDYACTPEDDEVGLQPLKEFPRLPLVVVRHRVPLDSETLDLLGECRGDGEALDPREELLPLLIGYGRALLDDRLRHEPSGEQLSEHLTPVGMLLQHHENVIIFSITHFYLRGSHHSHTPNLWRVDLANYFGAYPS